MKKHVLLIDDDKDEMIILSAALQDTGLSYKCTWAQGVDHALKMLAYMKPDLIFIDLNMPLRNGIDGISSIRQNGHLHEVPIILYSNNIDDSVDLAMHAGADLCVKKPISINEISALLLNVFGHLDTTQRVSYELP
ncbi:response regulator [Sediminibacterium ginsengisoli]|uniref:Response regulator receiver domain-containing protein n=1 Tax=Sediminibacterium ginsengisoli TaxID=413434 RepID=A0A1T4KSN9_9BACT|nr:response regulator [Sediminibacterium ginsengisoli]SJZ45360.1 Response regulator receiver domain-containing protein [Sediminibacterium ginsengisoli]